MTEIKFYMRTAITLALAIIFVTLSCKKEKKNLAVLSTTTPSNITANSVQSGGNINDDGGSTVTKRGVCWATHAGPTVADSITSDGTGTGNFTSSISGLSANTMYYIRAYAINGSGTSYGQEVTFTTAKGVPTITTAAITDIVSLSAKSGGNITNDGGATITARGIVFSSSANPTLSNFKTSDGTGTGSFVSTMTPLGSQIVYYVRAYATNSYGTAYGNQVQFTSASSNTVTDVEGNVYTYVTLGGKQWMASNLKVTKYKNGDAITNGLTGFNWMTNTSGAYTFPNADVSKKDSLGLLYSIHAIKDNRGVCPTGWHVPTDAEWKALEVSQGMTQVQADGTDWRGTIGTKLINGGSSGLNLKYAGILFPDDGGYYYYGESGLFWTSTTATSTESWLRAFNLSGDANGIYRNFGAYGMSVRCVKD